MTLVVSERKSPMGAAVAVCLFAGILFISPSQAGFEDPDDVLARPSLYPATVWADDAAYVLGGTGASDRIQRYDPATGDTTLLDTRLPHGIVAGSAVWDGQAIHIFGGRKGYDFLDTIYRFDPQTEVVTLTNARLQEPIAGTSAVWTGDAAYVLGGYRDCLGDCQLYTDAIQRYDPVTDQLTVMSATLALPARAMGVTWDGDQIVIVGGHQCVGTGYSCRYDQNIHLYDPANDLLSQSFHNLPMGTVNVHAVWDGASIFLVGGVGWDRETYTFHDYHEIRRLDLDAGADPLTDTASAIPFDDAAQGVVWTGERILMLGGRACAYNGICDESDKIWHYDPRPQPPELDADWGTHVGEVRLEWEPAGPEAYPLTAYRIWRGASSDDMRLIAEIGPDATSYEDMPPLPLGSYHYAVTATDAGGYESVRSNVVRESPALLPSMADRNANGIPDGLEYL